MNSGSIHNPTTKEARIFAFLVDNVGAWFTTLEVAKVAESVCVHTYICGVRNQCGAVGYELQHRQSGRLHYYRIVVALQPIPTAAQMELMGVCA